MSLLFDLSMQLAAAGIGTMVAAIGYCAAADLWDKWKGRAS